MKTDILQCTRTSHYDTSFVIDGKTELKNAAFCEYMLLTDELMKSLNAEVLTDIYLFLNFDHFREVVYFIELRNIDDGRVNIKTIFDGLKLLLNC
uniref:Uncharacterized protein n=1 Tax=Panagrolaimus superbus TaxID=310955 RepID=A0A914Y3L9_9BILA